MLRIRNGLGRTENVFLVFRVGNIWMLEKVGKITALQKVTLWSKANEQIQSQVPFFKRARKCLELTNILRACIPLHSSVLPPIHHMK